MRASSTRARSGSLSCWTGLSGVDTRVQPFLVPGGGGGTPGSGGGNGGGPPFLAGCRSSSVSTWVMLARSLDRLEIGGVTRWGPPRRPGGNGVGVGERGNVPAGGPASGLGGRGGGQGASVVGGCPAAATVAESTTVGASLAGSGGGVLAPSSGTAFAL